MTVSIEGLMGVYFFRRKSKPLDQAGLTFQHPLKPISLDCIVKSRLFDCAINLIPNASTVKTTAMGRVSKDSQNILL